MVLGGDEDFWTQGRHRPDPDHDELRHLLHAALLPRRPADLPGPQRPHQRVHLRAGAGPLPRRRARPRPVRPEHLRRHPHRGHRRLAGRQGHRRQRLRADRVWPTTSPTAPTPSTATSSTWPSSCCATSATTPRTTPSTRRWTPTVRWASSSTTCSTGRRLATRRAVRRGRHRVREAGTVRGVAAAPRDVAGLGGPGRPR